MLIDFYIHGVPKGQDIWGANEDIVYIQNFYTSRTDRTRFLIQIRDVKDRRYCYYSYLKYNNIVDSSGRPGAYFGITIRIDAYCMDIINIYNILDAVYKRYFVGNYLVEEQQRTKFIISDFQSKDKENKETFDVIMSLFKILLTSSDFVSLQDFTVSNMGSVMELNILDCSKENVISAIKKSSAIAISPFYPMLRDKDLQNKLDKKIALVNKSKEDEIIKVKTAYEKQITQICNERDNSVKEKEDLKALLQDVKKENNSLNTKISHLQIECNKQNKSQEAVKIVESLREPLTKLSNLIGENKPLENHKTVSKERKKTVLIKSLLPIINTLLLLLIVLWQFFRVSNDQSIQNTKEYISESNTMEQTYNTSSTARLEKITLKEENDSFFIDTLITGNEYILNLKKGYYGECKWNASEAANIITQNDSSCKIRINKTDVKEVIVNVINDSTIAERKFNLKDKNE